MNRRGFNPAELVERGVFDSLEEADRVLCALDDARPGPQVIAVSWLEGFKFQVSISAGRGAVLQSASPSRTSLPIVPADPFSAARVSGGAAAGQRFPVSAVEAGSGVENISQRSPELLPEPASVCPWCAVERAMSGQGSAATAPFVSRTRCARHAPVEAMERPTTPPQQAVARDASPLAPAAALLFPGSAGAEPFHPVLNPNAGVRPAYPKGRWT